MVKTTEHSSEIKAATKASLALIVATFLQKGISVISVPLFTRMMSSSEYGRFSVFSSWYEVTAIFSTLCLSKGVYNNGLLKYKDDRDCFTFSLCILSTFSTIIIMSVVTLINIVAPNVMNLEPYMLVLMGLSLLGEPAYNMWRVKERFEYRYRMQTAVSITLALSSTISAVLLVYEFNQDTVMARSCGYYSIVIMYHIFFYCLHAYKARLRVDTRYWKYALKFNIPLIPHYLSLYILNHFDRIMIDGYIGASNAAMYTLAYQLGSVVSILWTSINASLIPYTYERCKREEFDILNNTTIIILEMYAVACSIVIVFAPEAIRILAPSQYGEAIGVVPAVVGGVFCSSLYYVFANVVYYYEQPKYVMIASIISAITNVVLNSIMIPRFGINGAAYATILCYIIQAIIDCWAMLRVVNVRIYNVTTIGKIGALVVIWSILIGYTYSNITLRLIATTIIVAIILVNYSNFLRMVNEIRTAKGSAHE